jgi:L-alanine-DL-glutamate epimerase-like enolase superfamily enzyme
MDTGKPMTRREFLKASATTVAVSAVGDRLLGQQAASQPATRSIETPEPVYLKSWELVEYPSLPGKNKQLMKLTASNGAFGVSRAIGKCTDLAAAEKVIQGADLLQHEKLFDLMVAKSVPQAQRGTVDIACWDLHARMLKKPLHALLGTKKTKILRYGDVRGSQPDFSPQKYAGSVAKYFERSGLQATKLHFPGALGTKEGIPFKDVLETLKEVRKAVGKEKVLAWDPYPGSAESAANSVDEAKEILKLMDELGYTWIEGPLPPVPFEQQIPKYVELMKAGSKQRIQAEGPGSPIGDGTSFEVMKQWVEVGAVSQCSTDVYIVGGLTVVYRILEYARTNPDRKLTINLHWDWAPHAHLAMAYDEKVLPIQEFPYGSEVPPSCLDGAYLLAPDWPGIYCIK